MITTPAVKGRMGSTNYYFTKLPASHLTGSVRPACEVDELWNNDNPEESLQRKPNMARIKDAIAPYLANNPESTSLRGQSVSRHGLPTGSSRRQLGCGQLVRTLTQ